MKRKVKCSFEDEVHDERYNPYLRLRRRSSTSVSGSVERGSVDDNASLSSMPSSLGSHPDGHNLPSYQGPLKTLNSFQADDPFEYELHDPIARSVLTRGEAYVIFRLQVFPSSSS
jgi:hypothetical protein